MKYISLKGLVGIAFFFIANTSTIAISSQGDSAEFVPVLRCAPVGFCFCVRPAFEKSIAENVSKFRSRISQERKAGKYVAYMSVPLSSINGGNFGINRDVAGFTKSRLEKEFGPDYFYVLDPASKDADLPDVSGQRASQGEYMFLWAQVLGGEDGFGRDSDLVYFVGPHDFEKYFRSKIQKDSIMATLASFFADRYKNDEHFRKEVDSGKLTLSSFIGYYGLRASTAFSQGAHDEWNIVSAVNAKRNQFSNEFGLSKILPVWFDGAAIEPGDFQDNVMSGNDTVSCSQ